MASPALLTEEEGQAVARDVHKQFGTCPGGPQGLRTWLGVPPTDNAHASAVYDLTTAAFDFPPHRAERSLVVCGNYRSGTSVVAESLAQAGGYGVPLEYFQAGANHRRFNRWAGEGNEFRRQVIAARTDSSGVFGAKLFWPDLTQLTGQPDVPPARAAGLIGQALPEPLFVWIRRRDTVAQALSTLRALHTNQWRALVSDPPGTATAETAPDEFDYDFDLVYRLVGMFVRDDSSWARCFAASEPRCFIVWYEEIAADSLSSMAALTARLAAAGMPPRNPGPYRPRLAKQAPPSTAMLTRRFLRDLRGC